MVLLKLAMESDCLQNKGHLPVGRHLQLCDSHQPAFLLSTAITFHECEEAQQTNTPCAFMQGACTIPSDGNAILPIAYFLNPMDPSRPGSYAPSPSETPFEPVLSLNCRSISKNLESDNFCYHSPSCAWSSMWIFHMKPYVLKKLNLYDLHILVTIPYIQSCSENHNGIICTWPHVVCCL